MLPRGGSKASAGVGRGDGGGGGGLAAHLGQEIGAAHDAVARLSLELTIRLLITIVAQYDTRAHRHEVTAAGPLFPLLHGAAGAATEDGREGEVHLAQAGEEVRDLAHAAAAGAV